MRGDREEEVVAGSGWAGGLGVDPKEEEAGGVVAAAMGWMGQDPEILGIWSDYIGRGLGRD